MRHVHRFLAALLPCLLGAPAPSMADPVLVDKMMGKWEGSGRVTYSPTWTFDFKCELEGKPGQVATQVDLLGKCWSGPMWGRMAAALRYDAATRSWAGRFRDGTDTFVIEIAGRSEGDALTFDLSQGPHRGALGMAFQGERDVVVTVSVLDPRSARQVKVADLTLNKATALSLLRQ